MHNGVGRNSYKSWCWDQADDLFVVGAAFRRWQVNKGDSELSRREVEESIWKEYKITLSNIEDVDKVICAYLLRLSTTAWSEVICKQSQDTLKVHKVEDKNELCFSVLCIYSEFNCLHRGTSDTEAWIFHDVLSAGVSLTCRHHICLHEGCNFNIVPFFHPHLTWVIIAQDEVTNNLSTRYFIFKFN